MILLFRSLEGFLLFKKRKEKPTACKLPVNVWQCGQIQTWRHCSMIHSVTGVNLRETGVRGTNRSHVGKGSPLMPRGLLCEKRQEGKRRAEYWWCQLPCAESVLNSAGGEQKKKKKRACADVKLYLFIYLFITRGTGKCIAKKKNLVHHLHHFKQRLNTSNGD